MFKSTNIHWLWTPFAESESKKLNIVRKAGDPVMERDNSGEWVKRLTVPRSWVEEGYVEEADGEQLELF